MNVNVPATIKKRKDKMAKIICGTCELFDDFEGDCIQDFEPDKENHCKYYEEED